MGEKTVVLTKGELDAMMEEAVTRALHRIGLSDEGAGKDITEVRNLLEAWRMARRTVWKTVIQTVTMFMLMLVAAGAVLKIKGG